MHQSSDEDVFNPNYNQDITNSNNTTLSEASPLQKIFKGQETKMSISTYNNYGFEEDGGPEQGVQMGDLAEPHMRPKYEKEDLCRLVYFYEQNVKEVAKWRIKLNDASDSNK